MIIIKDKEINGSVKHTPSEMLKGQYRPTVKITTDELTFQEALEIFTDGVNWGIKDNDTYHDWSNFDVAGAVSDNRDGSISIIMGKMHEADLLETLNPSIRTRAEMNSYVEAIKLARETLSDELACNCAIIYPIWKVGTNYNIGERVLYNDILYKVLQDHISQEDWNPEDSSSLFAKVLIPNKNVIPTWEQPDSTNPYMKGDKVTFEEKIWESTVDNNVWRPGEYGWSAT